LAAIYAARFVASGGLRRESTMYRRQIVVSRATPMFLSICDR